MLGVKVTLKALDGHYIKWRAARNLARFRSRKRQRARSWPCFRTDLEEKYFLLRINAKSGTFCIKHTWTESHVCLPDKSTQNAILDYNTLISILIFMSFWKLIFKVWLLLHDYQGILGMFIFYLYCSFKIHAFSYKHEVNLYILNWLTADVSLACAIIIRTGKHFLLHSVMAYKNILFVLKIFSSNCYLQI